MLHIEKKSIKELQFFHLLVTVLEPPREQWHIPYINKQVETLVFYKITNIVKYDFNDD